MSSTIVKFDWEAGGEDYSIFSVYESAREFITRSYSVAQFNQDIKTQRADFIQDPDTVTSFYFYYKDEINKYLTIEDARKLAGADIANDYDELKKFHVNNAIKLIMGDINTLNYKLLKKHSNETLEDLINFDMPQYWGCLSRENLSQHKNLREYIISRDRGTDVLGAINLLTSNPTTLFVGEGESIMLLSEYTKDVNSKGNYYKYCDAVGRNLTELVIHMANASVHEAYKEIFHTYHKEIIDNPKRTLSEIVVEKTKADQTAEQVAAR